MSDGESRVTGARRRPASNGSRPQLARRAELWRLDWRFLLPIAPGAGVERFLLRGGPARLATALEATGLARQVVTHSTNGEKLDGVAILAGAVDEDTVSQMRPGASLYWEVGRSPHQIGRDPFQAERWLTAMGLRVTGLFAVGPHFREPRIFLPLQAPGALAWYVDTLYEARRRHQALLELLLRLSTNLRGDRFARIAPYYAITATVDRQQQQPLPPAGVPAPLWDKECYPVLLADGGNRVTLLPFPREGVQPRYVLKIPKRPSFNERTAHEQFVLQQLRRLPGGKVRGDVPQSLGTVPLGNVVAGRESYLPGISLLRSSGRWGASLQAQLADLKLATEWLISFHQQPLSRLGGHDSTLSAVLEPLLDRFRRCFGTTTAEARLFRLIKRELAQVGQVSLRLVFVHRDYNVWNLYRTADHLNVIDWEGGQLGPPLVDLLHFVTHWHDTVAGLETTATQREGFRQLFVGRAGQTPHRRAIWSALARYMQALHIAERLLPPLLVYTWVELTLRRYEQQLDMGGAPADPRQGNRNFAFLNVLAAGADTLFAEAGHG